MRALKVRCSKVHCGMILCFILIAAFAAIFVINRTEPYPVGPRFPREYQDTSSDVARLCFHDQYYVKKRKKKKVSWIPFGYHAAARRILETDLQEPDAKLWEDYQTNQASLVGAEIYENPSVPECLYLKTKEGIFQFVLFETTFTWVRYQGRLYVEEKAYHRFVLGEEEYEKLIFPGWPEEEPGITATLECWKYFWDPEYRFPNKDCTTNDPFFFRGGLAYYPESDILLISGGMQNVGPFDTVSKYLYYVPER